MTGGEAKGESPAGLSLRYAGADYDLAPGESVLDAGRADVPGPAEEEDPHGFSPGPSRRSEAAPGTR